MAAWPRLRRILGLVALALLVALGLRMVLLSIGSRTPPGDLGIREGRLAPCPRTPNCVTSDATEAAHFVEPLELGRSPEYALDVLRESVRQLPRCRIVEEQARYLRVECSSLVLRFVDDLELHVRPDEGIIAVRSASRVGTSDLGVNRRRVERLREIYQGLLMSR